MPPNIHLPGSSSQEDLQELQDVLLDIHLPESSTQEDVQESERKR